MYSAVCGRAGAGLPAGLAAASCPPCRLAHAPVPPRRLPPTPPQCPSPALAAYLAAPTPPPLRLAALDERLSTAADTLAAGVAAADAACAALDALQTALADLLDVADAQLGGAGDIKRPAEAAGTMGDAASSSGDTAGAIPSYAASGAPSSPPDDATASMASLVAADGAYTLALLADALATAADIRRRIAAAFTLDAPPGPLEAYALAWECVPFVDGGVMEAAVAVEATLREGTA